MIDHKKLRQLRKRKGWTQGHAAQQIGIQQSYLSKLENDQAIASEEIIRKISDTYDCQPTDISAYKTPIANFSNPSSGLLQAITILMLLGLLLFSSAYFGVFKNNTAYTYELIVTNHNLSAPNYIVTDEYKGEKYSLAQQQVATYRLIGERPIKPLVNRVLYWLGAIFILVGLALLGVRLVKQSKH